MIKGQEKLCLHIDRFTIDTLPRTILLLGAYGSGKHLIVNYIADKYNLEVEDISDNLTLELIDNISQRVSPRLYIINSNGLTNKNENTILKFLEEPLKNAFIIVLSESKDSIIPTVLNRCQVWEMNAYQKDFLSSFIQSTADNTEMLLKVADTPGKILEYQHFPLKDMFDLAYKIFNNIQNANFANVLTLSRFIAFKNEKDKFDFNLFIDILTLVSRELCVNNKMSATIYHLTNRLSNNRHIFNIDKKALFENYLVNLKITVNGESKND